MLNGKTTASRMKDKLFSFLPVMLLRYVNLYGGKEKKNIKDDLPIKSLIHYKVFDDKIVFIDQNRLTGEINNINLVSINI